MPNLLQHPPPQPTLLINKAQAQRNIRKIAAKAARSNTRFRPHFKTHQSAAVGEWFREEGLQQIAVSSLDMAEYFAAHGWQDIMIAFPINPLLKDRLYTLANQIKLHLITDHPSTIAQLQANPAPDLTIWIEVDIGEKRSGIWWEKTATILDLHQKIEQAPNLHFGGIVAHAGHSYAVRGAEAIQQVYHDSMQQLDQLRTQMKQAGIDPIPLSFGDTPTCSTMHQFDGIEEIRPGNFVCYDLVQHQIGSCTLDEIAIAMSCPVVSLQPERQEVIIHGGAVHFSKDFLLLEDGRKVFGLPVQNSTDSMAWGPLIEGAYLKAVSQEHGVLHLPPHLLETVSIGDTFTILPAHACLTADLMGEFYTTKGAHLSGSVKSHTTHHPK